MSSDDADGSLTVCGSSLRRSCWICVETPEACLKIEIACATIEAGSPALAGSNNVVPSFAIFPNAYKINLHRDLDEQNPYLHVLLGNS